MKCILKLVPAIVASPIALIPTFLLLAVALYPIEVMESVSTPRGLSEAVKTALHLSLIGIGFAWAINLCFGTPVFLLLRHFGLASHGPCALTGAIFGLLFGAELGLISSIVIYTTAGGAAVAAAFCDVGNYFLRSPVTAQPGVWC